MQNEVKKSEDNLNQLNEISSRLRERATGGYIAVRPDDEDLMLAAANEIDRIYLNMIEWKKIAGNKYIAWNETRTQGLKDEREAFDSWAMCFRPNFCDTSSDRAGQWVGWKARSEVATPPATTGASTARPDWLEYDPAEHILTIYGVRYSGDLFSGLGLGPVGVSFTILAREDGVLTLCRGPVASQAKQEKNK